MIDYQFTHKKILAKVGCEPKPRPTPTHLQFMM